MLIYDTSQSYSSVCEALFPQSVTPGTIGAFDGLNVLICWEHSTIQSLCIALLQTMGPLNRINTTPINYSGIDNYADPFFENLNPCPDGNFLCNDSTNSFYIPPNTNPGSTVAPIGPNSQTYPYWSNYNFDSVFWFSSKEPSFNFDFQIFIQPCYTCYPSCGLNIGLYQPITNACDHSIQYYSKTPSNLNVENMCEVPTSWAV